MIVKNESRIIRRCLASVTKIIDHWVIVDTGSTDGTQEIIREYMSDIPGQLVERPWQDFAKNRNEALALARNRADYFLFLDADDTLEISGLFDKSSLDRDCYWLHCCDPSVDCYRILLINNDPLWRWAGALHEELQIARPVTSQILSGIEKNGLARDGVRVQDPDRYLHDAQVLEKALEKNPGDTRTVFFLAQSYATAFKLPEGLKYYKMRSEMGGYEEEVFWSLYSIGCIEEDLRKSPEQVIGSYRKAHEFDLNRAEPLCSLSRYYLKIGDREQGYAAAKAAMALPRPRTLFYVRRDVYEYASLLYFSYAAHLLGRFDEATESYQKLLQIGSLPSEVRASVENFLALAKKREKLLARYANR